MTQSSPRRLLAAYLAVVLLPLGALAWLASRLTRAEIERANQRVGELAAGALRGVAAEIDALLAERRRSLAAALRATPRDVGALRATARRLPEVRQVFWVAANGQLAHPSPGGELDREEAAFLRRTASLWSEGWLATQGGGGSEAGAASTTPNPSTAPASLATRSGGGTPPSQQDPQVASLASPAFDQVALGQATLDQVALDQVALDQVALDRRTLDNPAADGAPSLPGRDPRPTAVEPGGASAGWHPWHLEDGLHLLTWERQSDGSLLGAELDRVRLLADLVTALPDAAQLVGGNGRVRLLDAEGRVLHQWGRFDPAGRPAVARVSLAPPLAAWSLEYFDPGVAAPGAAVWVSGAVPWIGAIALLVAALAVHVYRASRRELLDAASRVTFVNQVSHELKTPLTNVRMYAELLAAEVADDPTATRYATVVTSESERLSRLIGNVLTFARSERRELSLHPRPGVPDEVVSHVLATFGPALAGRGVTVTTALAAARPVRCDADALEQILANLLSNVEKYASTGGSVHVETALLQGSSPATAPTTSPNQLVLRVTDRGPGIAAAQRERIFAPFARISNALTDGVSGTGLGLTIARELARAHGGDLSLVPSPPGGADGAPQPTGATFEARLAVTPVAESPSP